ADASLTVNSGTVAEEQNWSSNLRGVLTGGAVEFHASNSSLYRVAPAGCLEGNQIIVAFNCCGIQKEDVEDPVTVNWDYSFSGYRFFHPGLFIQTKSVHETLYGARVGHLQWN
ncbi:hypothetical protein Ancab_012842, partial [Ancistrocladus abbreviatus]